MTDKNSVTWSAEELKSIKNRIKRKIMLTELQLDILYKILEIKDVNLERISKELGVPKSTIHYNFKKLEENDLIKGVALDIDEELLGLDITAISLVRTKYVGGTGNQIGEELAKIPGVIAVYYVLGDVDFIVISKALNREDLKRIINSISKVEGVERSSTHYVLNIIKEEKNLFANYPIEVAKLFFGQEKSPKTPKI